MSGDTEVKDHVPEITDNKDGTFTPENGIGEEMQGGLAGEVITLSEDEYFVLADNRDSTPDSREPSVRNIKKDDIIGKAIFCIWPLQNIGLVR